MSSLIASKYAPSTLFLVINGIIRPELTLSDAARFVTSDDGYVITAAHNVEDKSKKPLKEIVIRGSLGQNFDPKYPSGVIFPLS